MYWRELALCLLSCMCIGIIFHHIIYITVHHHLKSKLNIPFNAKYFSNLLYRLYRRLSQTRVQAIILLAPNVLQTFPFNHKLKIYNSCWIPTWVWLCWRRSHDWKRLQILRKKNTFFRNMFEISDVFHQICCSHYQISTYQTEADLW